MMHDHRNEKDLSGVIPIPIGLVDPENSTTTVRAFSVTSQPPQISDYATIPAGTPLILLTGPTASPMPTGAFTYSVTATLEAGTEEPLTVWPTSTVQMNGVYQVMYFPALSSGTRHQIELTLTQSGTNYTGYIGVTIS